jgi:sucrose-6-phosphate hydrolase SacC (GH32 family)
MINDSNLNTVQQVSRDLVNWVHLPIFLLPDPSVGLHNEGKGGIFSGSAVPMPWGLRIFYTDNYFGRKPMELQRMVDTRDGIHPFGRAQTSPSIHPSISLPPMPMT